MLNFPDLIGFTMTADGQQVVDIGDRCEHMLNVPRSQLIGDIQRLFACFQTEDQQTLLNIVQYVIAGNPVPSRRLQVADRSFQPNWVEFKFSPTPNANGDISGIIRDVTSEMTQIALQRNTNTRLQLVLDNLLEGIVVLDADHTIQFVNSAFLAQFNITTPLHDLVGMAYARFHNEITNSFIDPENLPTLYFPATDIPEASVHVATQLNGTVIEISQKALVAKSKVAGLIFSFRDVTDQITTQQRQQRLLDLEQLQQHIVSRLLKSNEPESVMDALLALIGHRLDVSRAYIFMFSGNQQLLNNTHEWCAPGTKPQIDNLQALPFAEIMPSYFPMLHSDSIIAPYHINELPADIQALLRPQEIATILHIPFYANERLQGFIGLDENRQAREWLPEEISVLRAFAESYGRALERLQYERQLIQTRDEAVRSSSLKSQFMSNISHEIRTPMTSVLGMLEILTESALEGELGEVAHEGLKSARMLQSVLDDMLDFSKLQAGRITIESRPTNLVDLANEVVMNFQHVAEAKALDFDLEVDNALPKQVIVDPERLRQILVKLVDNALKFTSAGRVHIRMSRTGQSKNHVRVRFEVIDTGIGIAPEQQNIIFEYFLQGDGSITRQFGGTGLGLPIAKQLVELMEGSIGVESTPGQGSIFSFVLSLPIPEAQQGVLSEGNDFSHVRILLVDANNTARTVVSMQLRQWKCTVDEVRTSEEGFALLQNAENYDAIFLHTQASLAQQEKIAAQLLATTTGRPLLMIHIADEPTQLTDQSPFDVQFVRPIASQQLLNTLRKLQTLRGERASMVGNPILVVEGNPTNQRLVRSGLSPLNVEVHLAENGIQALQMVKQRFYSLILMDIRLAHMNGASIVNHIRDYEILNQTERAAIILTASDVSHAESHSYSTLDIDGIISGPFTPDNLRIQVEAVLRQFT